MRAGDVSHRLAMTRGDVGLLRRGWRPRQPVCWIQARVGQGGQRITAPAGTGKRIATPVCALARNDRRGFSQDSNLPPRLSSPQNSRLKSSSASLISSRLKTQIFLRVSHLLKTQNSNLPRASRLLKTQDSNLPPRLPSPQNSRLKSSSASPVSSKLKTQNSKLFTRRPPPWHHNSPPRRRRDGTARPPARNSRLL